MANSSNRNIQKAVIITGGRTGSTALVRALNTVNGLRFHGEIFLRFNKEMDGFQKYCARQNKQGYYDTALNPRYARHFSFLSYDLVTGYMSELFYDPKFSAPWVDFEKRFEYFENTSFAKESVVGFKIAYGCYRGYAGFRKWLKKNPDVKVIHLIRKNFFDIYLSWQYTSKTRVFHSYENQEIEKIKIDIDINDLKNFINEQTKIALDFRSKISLMENPNLEISYEDIFKTGADIPVLSDFLSTELSKEVFESGKTSKLKKPELSEVITNYQEVESFLKTYKHTID